MMRPCFFSERELRECWIGLHRDSDVCTCSMVSAAECEACRASWSWSDDTEMTWANWLPREPGTSACGRLTAEGWAEYMCSEKYRFVCEKGS